MSFPDFPSLVTTPAITARSTFRYPEDTWHDPAVITTFEDQQSVQVQSTGSGGFWGSLLVVIQCPEADADVIFNFLKAQRLVALPFYFTHRKRGRILVRYWPGTNPPQLPYKRIIAGTPDLVEFVLPLRQEGGS